MKIVAILAAVSLAGLSSAFGLGLDVEALGESLNGWSKKRTATYTIDSQKYRTHVPTMTRNLNGGMFVSMRVEHLSGLRPDATGYLELTFAPDGYLGAAQIRLTMNGKKYDTGQVLREADAVASEGQSNAADWRSAHTKMVLDLFRALDQELAKSEGGEEEGRKDLWGRFKGSKLNEADISAALRHNLNLLLTVASPGSTGG